MKYEIGDIWSYIHAWQLKITHQSHIYRGDGYRLSDVIHSYLQKQIIDDTNKVVIIIEWTASVPTILAVDKKIYLFNEK